MKLYLKHKGFSWVEKFTILNADEKEKYAVQGEALSVGKRLHVYDMENKPIAFIKQKFLKIKPCFEVQIHGRHEFDIMRKGSINKPSFQIEGLAWTFQGDVYAHDYEIIGGFGKVASVKKTKLTSGDAYEINIVNTEQEMNVLAVVLSVNCIIHGWQK